MPLRSVSCNGASSHAWPLELGREPATCRFTHDRVERFADHDDLRAAVLRLTRRRIVAGHRAVVCKALRGDARVGDTALLQCARDRLRACLGERLVVFVRAGVIGVAFDDHGLVAAFEQYGGAVDRGPESGRRNDLSKSNSTRSDRRTWTPSLVCVISIPTG